MRGSDGRSGSLFSYVDLEARVRRDHPLRPIREIANAALAALSEDFVALYPPRLGRPSIAPERLLRAMLLQAFYGIRSERQLMERMEFDLLFRWFVGLGMDDLVWDHSSFTKNWDRLLEGEIAAKFLRAVLAQPRVKRLLSSDHFSVAGTLLEAWASLKSFRRKDGSDKDADGPGRNAERDFKNEKRSNDTHLSTSDPEARLYKKGDGQPARLCYLGHALMENRHGLVVDGGVTLATGTAEREAALAMIDRRPRRRITLGADKAYDVEAFVGDLRRRQVTPHIAIDGHLTKSGKPRKTAIDRHHPPCRLRGQPALSQTYRGGVRLDQRLGQADPGQAERARQGRRRLHPGLERLQPDPPAQAAGDAGMSVLGKWRITQMPDYTDDFPDMMEPAYIRFGPIEGEFAFGCVTGQIWGGADTDAIQFSWAGANEMDEASGDGWAELQPDGSLKGEICFHNRDEAAFVAKRWASSTAC
jgi:transposase